MIGDFIAYGLGACLLFYCGLVLYALFFLRKNRPNGRDVLQNALATTKGADLFFTVIIPARNEAENIEACLKAVLNQDYPHFEVILINDHSTDNTLQLAQAIAQTDSRLTVINLESSTSNAYKKAAITQAISLAKGNVIAQTDADCIMDERWLSALVEAFQHGADLVSAPVQLSMEKLGTRNSNLAPDSVSLSGAEDLFKNLQKLEHQGLVMLGGGSLLGGFPNMANGANLAYRKAAFDAVGGFAGVDHVASGDDELLLQKMHQAGLKLDFVQKRDAIVYTWPLANFAAFKSQRLRWVSKARAYKNRAVNVVQMISFLGFLAFPAWLVMGYWELFLGGFLVKFLVDMMLMWYASAFFRTFRLLWLLPILEPLYVAYVLWVGVAGNFIKTYSWKDRTVS